jgi:hypothetical protein
MTTTNYTDITPPQALGVNMSTVDPDTGLMTVTGTGEPGRRATTPWPTC